MRRDEALLTRMTIGGRLWLLLGIVILGIGCGTAVVLYNLRTQLLQDRIFATLFVEMVEAVKKDREG